MLIVLGVLVFMVLVQIGVLFKQGQHSVQANYHNMLRLKVVKNMLEGILTIKENSAESQYLQKIQNERAYQ